MLYTLRGLLVFSLDDCGHFVLAGKVVHAPSKMASPDYRVLWPVGKGGMGIIR